jgi:hypothetical protein
MNMAVPVKTLAALSALLLLGSLAPPGGAATDVGQEKARDDFSSGNLDGWQIREGKWSVRDGKAVAEKGFSLLLHKKRQVHDFEVSADVSYSYTETHAASGLVFRYKEDATGYAVGLREVEKGVDPKFGPWERPVLQLFRIDRDGWKLLQESKVMECRSGRLRHVKVVCRGPNIWVFYEDMNAPVLRQHDAEYDRAGWVGLWKDHLGTGAFANFSIAAPSVDLPPPLRTDWSWVRGTVYVRSDAVNSVQMWRDYWDHTDILDRELSYAGCYGFNMVQVYLHWIVWDHDKTEYLKKIEDFLTRASRYGLKVNFILWDDCGQVEPSLMFADPIPGQHNSQMMPNPSHEIRDSESEMTAHKDSFRGYVEGVVGRFKDDKRIVFWQLYNECMGPREQYRTGEADANLNRLLGWTRAWVKGTGTKTPVTATGGGFYGPKYSDFYTFHSYRLDRKQPLPNADGGPEHLCTETLDRPDCTLLDCIKEFGAKKNGFVVWELMIGRDNCRFPWGHPDGADEPSAPFHGVVYPDGHPWDVAEVKALLGDDTFAALKDKVFQVEYFDGPFKTSKKTSITPRIDFDLTAGPGSPDASAGLGRDDFAIRWTGRLVAPAAGTYTLFGDGDGVLRVWIGETQVIDKNDPKRSETQGEIKLQEGKPYRIKVEYVHHDVKASCHVSWSGPNFSKRILRLDSD